MLCNVLETLTTSEFVKILLLVDYAAAGGDASRAPVGDDVGADAATKAAGGVANADANAIGFKVGALGLQECSPLVLPVRYTTKHKELGSIFIAYHYLHSSPGAWSPLMPTDAATLTWVQLMASSALYLFWSPKGSR